MPTPPQRWPNHAESNRIEAKEEALYIAEVLQDALNAINSGNPTLCEINVLKAQGSAHKIMRILTEAKVGK